MVAGAANSRKHRGIGRLAILQEHHLVAGGQRAADDGLFQRNLLVENIDVAGFAFQVGHDGRAFLRRERATGILEFGCLPGMAIDQGIAIGERGAPCRHQQDDCSHPKKPETACEHGWPATRDRLSAPAAQKLIAPPPAGTSLGLPDNQRAGACGTTTMVSPPVLPGSPVAPVPPVDPVCPVEPVSPVEPVVPGAPGGPAGPGGPGTGVGTVTTAGCTTVGCTTVGFSHALKASATTTAEKIAEYFILIPLGY